uniref:Capsid protein n=1 Tax=Dromedary stool-associated circular ssDNA virus TaxID=1574422 RepID=A0A0A1EJ53_9VIRU|nr:hypothetical protein [Dromedary stool-associated circular ssDNA virus]
MPIYRRGYRRRFRRYRRYGRRYLRRRSYARRYVNASSRSSLRMKCNQTQTTTATAGHSDAATGASVWRLRPYANEDTSLTNNPLYQAYLSLYEETKLIGMKVNLAVTSQVGGVDTPSLQIYTAWDRRHGYDDDVPTVAQIKAAATSSVATALNNNVAKLSRSLYASDLIEKAQWHDSSVTANVDNAWLTAGNNPNFFCPAFFFFFNSPSLAATHAISFSVSVTYYVAFRNPKYGGSSASKDLPARTVTFAGGDDGGDMEEEEMLVSPRASASDLARIESFRYQPDAAAMADAEPAPLERRQRSAASQAAGNQPVQKKKNQ